MMMKIVIIFIMMANNAFARGSWFEEETKIVPNIGKFDSTITVDVNPYIQETKEAKNLMTTFFKSPVLKNYKTQCGLQHQLPKVDYLEDDLQERHDEMNNEMASVFQVFREVEPPSDREVEAPFKKPIHHLVKRFDPVTFGFAFAALVSVLTAGGAAGYGIFAAVQAQNMEGIHNGIIDTNWP